MKCIVADWGVRALLQGLLGVKGAFICRWGFGRVHVPGLRHLFCRTLLRKLRESWDLAGFGLCF